MQNLALPLIAARTSYDRRLKYKMDAARSGSTCLILAYSSMRKDGLQHGLLPS